MKKLSIKEMKSFAQSCSSEDAPLESVACTVYNIAGFSVSVWRLKEHVTEGEENMERESG